MGRQRAEASQEDKASTSEVFRRLATGASNVLGTHWAFMVALAVVLTWALSGPLFDFSETWQLLINSFTTIVTFLMVFLIQTTQNREAKATQLKLDELIRATHARNVFADLEDASDEELAEFQREFKALRQRGLNGKDAIVEAHSNVWDGDEARAPGRERTAKRARKESSAER